MIVKSKRILEHASDDLKAQAIYKNSQALIWADDQISKHGIIPIVDLDNDNSEDVSIFLKEGYYNIEDLKEFIEKAEDYEN